MNCCHLLGCHHQSLCGSCGPSQRELELHQFFLLYRFFLSPLSFVPLSSLSLVTINGNFHQFLASVVYIAAVRGKIVRTPAASKTVVIPKWCPSLPITSQPPLATPGASQHHCNATVIGVCCYCLPVLSLDNSHRGVPCHR